MTALKLQAVSHNTTHPIKSDSYDYTELLDKKYQITSFHTSLSGNYVLTMYLHSTTCIPLFRPPTVYG